MDWTEELGNFGTHHAEGYRVTYIRPECWRAYRVERLMGGTRLHPLGTFLSLAAAKNACGYDRAEGARDA